MKKLEGPDFDPFVIKRGEDGAAFIFPLGLVKLAVVASFGGDWDHVSVSLRNRTPIWAEMDWVKRHFFDDDEVVMQLHVAARDHISIHPHTLHLWRPHHHKIPLPPKAYV